MFCTSVVYGPSKHVCLVLKVLYSALVPCPLNRNLILILSNVGPVAQLGRDASFEASCPSDDRKRGYLFSLTAGFLSSSFFRRMLFYSCSMVDGSCNMTLLLVEEFQTSALQLSLPVFLQFAYGGVVSQLRAGELKSCLTDFVMKASRGWDFTSCVPTLRH